MWGEEMGENTENCEKVIILEIIENKEEPLETFSYEVAHELCEDSDPESCVDTHKLIPDKRDSVKQEETDDSLTDWEEYYVKKKPSEDSIGAQLITPPEESIGAQLISAPEDSFGAQLISAPEDSIDAQLIAPAFVSCGVSLDEIKIEGGDIDPLVDVGVKRERDDSESDGSIDWEAGKAKREKLDSESNTRDEGGDRKSDKEDSYISEANAVNQRFMYAPPWGSNPWSAPNFVFTGENKILVPFPEGNRPIDWFTLLFDDAFLNTTCELTSLTAMSRKAPSSFNAEGKPLTVAELKVFMGILLHTGTVRFDRLHDYWSLEPMLSVNFIKKRMVRDRFLWIFRHLTFVQDTPRNQAKMLICRFNDTMAKVYYPGKDLVVDEGVMMWNGRKGLADENLISGFKLTSLSESAGPIVKMTCSYAGSQDDRKLTLCQTAAVKELMVDKCSGHSLFVISDHLGFTMAKELLGMNTYCTGLIRSDRRGIPEELKRLKLKKGETAERSADGVMIGKWKRGKGIYYMSTEFNNIMAVPISSNENKLKEMPLPVLQTRFNTKTHMTEVIKPLMDYYPTFNYGGLQWHRKIFLHILQVIMLNAHKLYNFANSTTGKRELMDFHHFRIQVIQEFIGTGRNKRMARERSRIDALRAMGLGPSEGPADGEGRGDDGNPSGVHCLIKIPKRSIGGKRTVRRRCRMCAVDNIFSQTTFMCAQCPGSPPLCEVGCFGRFHALSAEMNK